VRSALAGQTGSIAYQNPVTGQNELATSVVLDNGWFAVVTLPEAKALEALNGIVNRVLAVLAAGVVLLLGASIVLARSIEHTLGVVAHAATGLASGDLDQVVPVSSADELGRTAAAVREVITYQQQMAAVASAIARGDLSQEIRPKSERDVLGLAFQDMSRNLRMLMERERRARAAAEHAVLLRDRVLHSISHDLTNPLAGIMGQSQLLLRRASRSGVPANDPLVDGLQEIVAGVRRAMEDVDELVDASRLQVGSALELQCTSTDLVGLTRHAIEIQRTLTSATLRLDTNAAQLIGWWDERRLARVVGNLLSNAVKYNRGGEPVTLTLSAERVGDQHFATLVVRDRGIGIPPADLERIFEWFHRAGNVGSIRGTGIGLASAYQIVRQHGGTLEVESKEGVRSTFTLRLPIADEPCVQTIPGPCGPGMV
jgi:signal transduction histidine kinase